MSYIPAYFNPSGITNVLNNGYQRAIGFGNQAYQSFADGVTAVYEFRKDPDLFQKTCQVGSALILAFNEYKGGRVLSKASVSLLHTSTMHNFLCFLKLPYNSVYTIRANTVDEFVMQESLAQSIVAEFTETITLAQAKEFAKDIITARLNEMTNYEDLNNYAYSSKEDFITAFKARLLKPEFQAKVTNLPGLTANEVLNRLAASAKFNLNVQLKHETLLSMISKVSFAFVDIGCIPMYFHEWGIFASNGVSKLAQMAHLGQYAQTFGQSRVAQWIGRQNVEQWVIVGCCVAFGAKLLESVRLLRDEKLTPNQRAAAKLDVAASATEFAFCYALAIGANQTSIIILTLIAKMTGIVSIMKKNKLGPEFFVRA